jgi:hypothetical protein
VFRVGKRAYFLLAEDPMVFRGHVQNGVVLLDGPVVLPDGAAVKVELIADDLKVPSEASTDGPASLEQQIAAIWSDMPSTEWAKLPHDLSDNLDHYLYSTPKK